MKLYHFHWV